MRQGHTGDCRSEVQEKRLPSLALPPLFKADLAGKVAAALLIALLAFALGQRLRGAVTASLRRRRKVDPGVALLTGRLAYFTILAVAALWILNIFGNGITPLLTVLGAVGLAVSLALQDVLRNLFAGFYLLIERPFMIGDQIELKGISGIVESIELRLTMLATLDGLRVTVPNATVFTEVIINRSAQPHRRWPVLLTLPPATVDLAPVTAAIERAAADIQAGAPAPTVVVQSASGKGTLVQIGFWAADAAEVGRGIMALRRELPGAIISVPGAPPLPNDLPVPPPAPRRVTRTRQRPRPAKALQQ